MCFNIEKSIAILIILIGLSMITLIGLVENISKKELSEKNKKILKKIRWFIFVIVQIIFGIYIFRCN